MISPLLANIYLHVLDTEFTRRGLGELVRYADDGVVLCRSAAQARAALDAIGEILGSLGLELHPDKTKVVDLRQGREGLDFLGCHFHARMSGRLWEQRRIVRYYLHRWPSQRAMKRLRDKIRDRTGRNRAGRDIRDVIADLNPVLRGSPGVLSMSHDVAPEHPTESFCNTSRGCGARCRRCSEARPARTCHMHDNLAGRRRADYAAATCTIRPYARFAPVCPPENRGWGNYFRTGNAAGKFRQADDYVVQRLRSLMLKKRGRNLRAGQAQAWTEEWFNGHGLHRLRGTIRYPKAA